MSCIHAITGTFSIDTFKCLDCGEYREPDPVSVVLVSAFEPILAREQVKQAREAREAHEANRERVHTRRVHVDGGIRQGAEGTRTVKKTTNDSIGSGNTCALHDLKWNEAARDRYRPVQRRRRVF